MRLHAVCRRRRIRQGNPVNEKVDWFQDPLRGDSYLDDKVSFELAGTRFRRASRNDNNDQGLSRKPVADIAGRMAGRFL